MVQRHLFVILGASPLMHAVPGNSSSYVTGMPHDGWLAIAQPFIAAYKAGAKSEVDFVETELLGYWHRPHPRAMLCPFDPAGPPLDAMQWAADAVFASASLRSPATLTVTSGNHSTTQLMQAGINYISVPMSLGTPSFQLERDGETIASGNSSRAITDVCSEILYNFNFVTGSFAASTAVNGTST